MSGTRPPGRASLWQHRDFRRLWAGQSVSELGSQVSVLAIPLVAIDGLHASAFAVGMLTTTATLPFLMIGLPVGAWVDRARRRRVLIAADMARAAVVASIPAAWALSALTLAQLYVVSLLAGVGTVFFDVAYQSYLPALVRPDQVVEGNAKLGATLAGAEVTGPAVAGLLIESLGAATAVLADAVSFAVSFLSVVAVRQREERIPHLRGEVRTTLRTEIAEGLRFVWQEPRIRSVCGATATSNLFSTMGSAVMLVFLRRQVHLSPGHIGVLLALGGTGGLIGAALAAPLASRAGVGRSILGAIAVAGIGGTAYPLVTTATADVLVVAGGLLISAGTVVYNVNQLSLRQTLCPLSLQGRMNATVRCVVWGTMPLGGLAGGVLASTVGLRPTLWVAGVGALSAIFWIGCSSVPALRRIGDVGVAHEPER